MLALQAEPMGKRKRRSAGIRIGRDNRDLGTPETRRKLEVPFWSTWERERLESIEELAYAFRLRVAALLIDAQRLGVLSSHAPEFLSDRDRHVYGRYVEWLGTMRQHYGARTNFVIQRMQAVILQHERCVDQGQFLDAVRLHVRVRSRYRSPRYS